MYSDKVIAIDINDVLRDNLGQFINMFQKHIDHSFDIEENDIDDFDLFNIFPFNNIDEYHKFKYIDYAFELFGKAEMTERNLSILFNEWVNKLPIEFDFENVPKVIIVSPLEYDLTIQATYSFLSRVFCRIREVYFPIDSSTIWDRCDVLITANPKLLEEVPEGKQVIKINKPYNKEVEAEYSFDKFSYFLKDNTELLKKIIG